MSMHSAQSHNAALSGEQRYHKTQDIMP